MQPQSKAEKPGTKIRPATALPWKAHSANKASNFGGYESHVRTKSGLPLVAKARGGDADTAEAAKQNATYIAHAANAYPMLVEALRDVLAMMHPEAVDGLIAAHAHALFRDLGEE